MRATRKKFKAMAGFTLIEMMIAVTVGLFILGAVSAVAINSARSSRANDRTSEMQTNGRYALDVLRRDVQHAGQSGLTPPDNMILSKTQNFFSIASGVTVNSDCSTGFALKLEQPIWGLNDTNPNNACPTIATGSYARGDVLVTRYADMTAWDVNPINAASEPVAAVTNDVYFRSAYDASRIFKKGVVTPMTVGTGPMQDQLVKTSVYYINPNTNGADGIPALYRLTLIAGTMTPELVASGIENLQVLYGVVDTAGNSQYLNAAAVTDWSLVKSVRVWLLARNSSSERNENYSNTTTYAMGDTTYTPIVNTNDQFRRQIYTATIKLRNEN